MLFTIMYFFVVSYFLGFSATSFVKNSDNFLERNLMRIGIGFTLIPLVAVAINLVGIPIDWKYVLVLSLVYPTFYLIRNFSRIKEIKQRLSITKSDLYIIAVLVIFAVTFYMYASGAFAYPYLENDDSWGHAETVAYISIEKDIFSSEAYGIRYVHPYPPAYGTLMALLHQTNNSVFWTLKFFNALIISLSIIYFYFFAKHFFNNSAKALYATIALAAMPAFMSHFIWALALTMSVFFVCFYALEQIVNDKKWLVVAALAMFAAFASSPTHSIYFGFFFALYFLGKLIIQRKFLVNEAIAGVLGVAMSVALWWGPMILKYGIAGTLGGLGGQASLGTANLMGSGDRNYAISDFLFAHPQNMINSPIGLGVVVSLMAALGILFILMRWKVLWQEKHAWAFVTLLWLAFALYAVNAASFTIKLSPFRTWMLLAIPIALLAAEGIIALQQLVKGIGGNTAVFVLIAIIIGGIHYTSFQQKYDLNTAQWPPGGFWSSGDELAAYLWLKDNTEQGAHVFGYVINGPIIGFDKFICFWCEDIKEFRKTAINQSSQNAYTFLKQHDFRYLIIDGQVARKYGTEAANSKAQEFAQSGLFQPVFQNNGAIIFKIS